MSIGGAKIVFLGTQNLSIIMTLLVMAGQFLSAYFECGKVSCIVKTWAMPTASRLCSQAGVIVYVFSTVALKLCK